MGQKSPADDRKLAVLAARQHGTVAYWQLRRLGFSARAIEYRVHTGRLHRLHKGVYAVGHAAVTPEGRDMAAVLACGPGALLSEWTAAPRWSLLRPVSGPVHVTVVGDHRQRRGIRVHCVKELHPHDRARRDGIPVTSVSRTLLDLAGVANERTLRRAVNQADRQGRLNRRAIQELLDRNPRRKGTKALKAVIAAVNPGTGRTRSEFEVDFLELCVRYGIPLPVVNGEVEGYEVDMHWPGTKVIVELDSYEYHRTRAQFTGDRRKWARLGKLGYHVLPVSDEWFDNDPHEVAETVKALLSASQEAVPRSPSARAAAPRP